MQTVRCVTRETCECGVKTEHVERGVALVGVGGAHSTEEAGNDRGGKEPWFRVLREEWTSGRLV